MVSRERIKINVSDDDRSELYDLNDELHNCWNNADYAGRRSDLLARLKQWQSATSDDLALS